MLDFKEIADILDIKYEIVDRRSVNGLNKDVCLVKVEDKSIYPVIAESDYNCIKIAVKNYIIKYGFKLSWFSPFLFKDDYLKVEKTYSSKSVWQSNDNKNCDRHLFEIKKSEIKKICLQTNIYIVDKLIAWLYAMGVKIIDDIKE